MLMSWIRHAEDDNMPVSLRNDELIHELLLHSWILTKGTMTCCSHWKIIVSAGMMSKRQKTLERALRTP